MSQETVSPVLADLIGTLHSPTCLEAVFPGRGSVFGCWDLMLWMSSPFDYPPHLLLGACGADTNPGDPSFPRWSTFRSCDPGLRAVARAIYDTRPIQGCWGGG